MSIATTIFQSGRKPVMLQPSLAMGGLLQRKCDCGSSAASLTGQCEECQGRQLQRKLIIGASNDPLEAEADHVADQVLAAGADSAARHIPPRIQRYAAQANGQVDTAPASVNHVLSSSGNPLDPALRQDMEQRFGHDFSQVRVHSGGAAEQSAREVNAHAYTVGHNVVFGAGRFAPETHEGQRLIAHELTHVVQQSGVRTIRGNNSGASPVPLVQRQITIPVPPEPFPLFRPIPMPRVGPIPLPDTGPLPPMVLPTPGDWEPELEIEDIPEEEEIEEPKGSSDSQTEPEPEPEPLPSEARPQTRPSPLPPLVPNPDPEDESKEDENVCGSKRMPLTKVTWSTGPLGQGGTVRASPLTRCPGNTVGSSADGYSTYPDQFACIKKASLSRTWLPLHLLHGPTRRTGSRNLHGPGNKRWNVIIGDTKLNGDMTKSVEAFVINRVYDWNQVVWLESKVVEFFPNVDFFAKKIALTWGLYNTATNSEVTTIGGGTFENKPENLPPPHCPPTSPAGASSAKGPASDFDTTISICLTSLKSQQPFPIANGGLELTLRTRPQGQNCNIENYSVALWKYNKHWVDGNFGSKTIPAGKTAKLRWRNLPLGDYYFIFTVGPHNPNCCLKGDMSVRTFYAQPGGPLEA